jgi:hypothetical protein
MEQKYNEEVVIMDTPTILFEAAKLHHAEIEKEMASWRMAHQAKSARPGMLERFVIGSKSLIKKMMTQKTPETHSQDDGLVLKARS